MTTSASISVDAGAAPAAPALALPAALYRFMAFPFPPGHFTVRSLRGREALSGLYSFDVIATGPSIGEGVVERVALGQRAVLILRAGKAPRAFHGVVSAVRVVGVRAADHAVQYRFRLVPRLWLLKKTRRSRVFQGQRVDQTIEAVLRESRLEARWLLRRAYPSREYCTQYEETDYQFITRLAAESGIFFSFSQSGALAEEAAAALEGAVGGAAGALVGAAASAALSTIFSAGETIVLSDDTSGYSPIDDGSLLPAAAAALSDAASAAGVQAPITIASPKLYYLSAEGTSAPAYDKITRFEPTLSVRTNAAVYREYDPEHPKAELTAKATAKMPGHAGASVTVGASFGQGGEIAARASIDPSDAITAALGSLLDAPELERYDHHAEYLFSKWGHSSEEPELILRQGRRKASVARGESTCPALAAGARFRLEDHPAAQLNREYVVTAVEHEGRATPQGEGRPEVYRNTFVCAPSDVVFCPPRPRRKIVATTLTATVVGPMGEEVHTDGLGRVKVQFHWDREGRRDERSSCWIRAMQAWSGAGWGSQFLPRVGMEVVVAFDGGDPDKPIVLGCLWNGTHPPAFLLPGDKTRSGIRTQTSPGGHGNNELSFEDKKGGEQIYLHAQRDFDESVLRNHTVDVGGDEFSRIGGDRRALIEGSSSVRVAGDKAENVMGDLSSEVTGSRVETTMGSVDRRISKDLSARIEGRELREVSGEVGLSCGDDLTLKIRGSKTVTVGRHDARRSYSLHVEGTSSLSSSNVTEIVSEEALVLRCGKSSVRITPEAIELDAPTLRLKADGSRAVMADDGIHLRSKGSGAEILPGLIALASGGGASIGLGGDAKIGGSKVLLNSPEQASDPPMEELPPPGTIELVDEEGNPLGYERYLVVFEDGSERSGSLDRGGRADIDGDAPGVVYFPERSPVDAPSLKGRAGASGEVRPYVVKQGDHLRKLAHRHGFDAAEVWEHPKNAELRALRRSFDVLAPGDILFLPTEPRPGFPFTPREKNLYTAKAPVIEVTLVFKDGERPLAQEPYEIHGLGGAQGEVASHAETDAEGRATLRVPVTAREVSVFFPRANVMYPVRIGDMDPETEMSGVKKRLQNLGYLRADVGPELDEGELVRGAIYAFQAAHGIPCSGKLDATTREALVTAHGL